jgi:hypothetical protein
VVGRLRAATRDGGQQGKSGSAEEMHRASQEQQRLPQNVGDDSIRRVDG